MQIELAGGYASFRRRDDSTGMRCSGWRESFSSGAAGSKSLLLDELGDALEVVRMDANRPAARALDIRKEGESDRQR